MWCGGGFDLARGQKCGVGVVLIWGGDENVGWWRFKFFTISDLVSSAISIGGLKQKQISYYRYSD